MVVIGTVLAVRTAMHMCVQIMSWLLAAEVHD